VSARRKISNGPSVRRDADNKHASWIEKTPSPATTRASSRSQIIGRKPSATVARPVPTALRTCGPAKRWAIGAEFFFQDIEALVWLWLSGAMFFEFSAVFGRVDRNQGMVQYVNGSRHALGIDHGLFDRVKLAGRCQGQRFCPPQSSRSRPARCNIGTFSAGNPEAGWVAWIWGFCP